MLQMLREGNKFILAIREVLIEDSGIFTCRATNPAGVAECSAELFVEGSFCRQHEIAFLLVISTHKFAGLFCFMAVIYFLFFVLFEIRSSVGDCHEIFYSDRKLL